MALLMAGCMTSWSQNVDKAFAEKIASKGIQLDTSTNIGLVNEQYEKNKEQWDAALNWLNSNDLANIPAGKHQIAGSKLTASVEDSANANLESRSSESHYHHIDLQLVVRGHEGFLLLDHESSTPNCKWKEDVIRYDYDSDKAKLLVGAPGTMYLFFPSDWHVAKVQTPYADQTLRVIVIKLDYIE